ncbi:hypothetical protein C2W64_01039 [Brevibacillus laterosporus]|uniref:Uncharacterized protein n=1 Tax=Brevibacillus laterosporus TaxID=1465 RepID=A0A518V4T5_BRELA|nr:hypothetical protein [Brevibacillus laterosporus]QDX91999.1 hypothetical protein EEL30_06240 [Brevibacillus laterosporus]RAP27207.1 hypothetical protein C2W64_01039 [Brevibacillus laterosporus]
MESKVFVTFQEYISHYCIDINYLKKGCDLPQHWDNDNLFIDKWSEFDKQYSQKMYRLDRFPTLIQDWEKHRQLVVFFDKRKEPEEQCDYLEIERKFLRVIKNLWTCSRIFVESSIHYDNIFPKWANQNKVKELQKKFNANNIEIIEGVEWEELEFLLILNFRNYISTCLSFVDLNLIIWPGDFACPTYLRDEANRELLEKICNVEGLYLYPLTS